MRVRLSRCNHADRQYSHVIVVTSDADSDFYYHVNNSWRLGLMNHLLRRAANYCSPTSSMKKVRRRPPSKRCDRNVSEDKTSSRSSEIGLVVMNCRGYANLENEVLYLPPRNQGTVKGNVVLIPGDAQDLHRRM